MRVIILSGIPGSGKDHYIGTLPAKLGIGRDDIAVCSADGFFVDLKGRYVFDPSKLGQAHGACLKGFVEDIVLSNHYGDRPCFKVLVVNNTNTTLVEIAPYYAIAAAYGLEVDLITLLCPPSIAAERNVHGVSLAACEAMDRRIRSRELPPFWLFGTNATVEQ